MLNQTTLNLLVKCLSLDKDVVHKNHRYLNNIFSHYNAEKISKSTVLNNYLKETGDKKTVSKLRSFFELINRFSESKNRINISSPEDAFNLSQSLRSSSSEILKSIYLNVKNDLIKSQNISMGGYNSLHISVADIFIPALKYNARNIIIIHNHPSGETTPSEEDIIFTRKVVKGADILGLSVIDHIIVSKNEFYSFKKEGLL